MAGLGDTTAALAAWRRQSKTTTTVGQRQLTTVKAFGVNPGALTMKVHAPPGLAPGKSLVVVLHGCTQTADAYAEGAGWIDLADRFGFALVCPEQTAANNPNRCFNWFEPGDIRRGSGEAASVKSMIDNAVARFGSDPAQIYITGLSAGGAMTSVMLATYPEVFAGGGIIAGIPYGVAQGVPEAFHVMLQGRELTGPALGDRVRGASSHRGPWPKISVWHGSADMTVRPSNADAIAQQWADVWSSDTRLQASSDGNGRDQWTLEGRTVIERHLLPGLAHGTPLATKGPEGVGHAGPFLLEAGVSSSRELLTFWGIAPRAGSAEVSSTPYEPLAAPTPSNPWRVQKSAAPLRTGADGSSVDAVIKKALRAAGLMK